MINDHVVVILSNCYVTVALGCVKIKPGFQHNELLTETLQRYAPKKGNQEKKEMKEGHHGHQNLKKWGADLY